MALGGITPMQRLAMSAGLHFWGRLKISGLPHHPFNGGLAPAAAEEKRNQVSGLS